MNYILIADILLNVGLFPTKLQAWQVYPSTKIYSFATVDSPRIYSF